MSPGITPLARVLIALPAVIFAGCLAAASGGPGLHECADQSQPSKLDYLVLASIADSPHLLAMASYRPTQSHHGEERPYPTND